MPHPPGMSRPCPADNQGLGLVNVRPIGALTSLIGS